LREGYIRLLKEYRRDLQTELSRVEEEIGRARKE
jgi:hypothetical protein